MRSQVDCNTHSSIIRGNVTDPEGASMEVSQNLKNKVEAEVIRCVNIANKHFKRVFDIPRIEFTVRGTTAGYASGTNVVNFNPVLLVQNEDDFIAKTVPHEVAHCIDAATGRDNNASVRIDRYGRIRRAKRSIHGPSWQFIMRLFGADPSRTHTYDTTNAQVRVKNKFEYHCQCCGNSVFVSSVIHNKVQRGARYWHSACGRGRGLLVFTQAVGKQTFTQLRAAQEAPPAPKAPTKEVSVKSLLPVTLPTGTVTNSREIALGILAKNPGISRQGFLIQAVDAGIKSTTASTYYATLRKKTE